ncbi:MAG: M23B-like protein peptidase [Candidatus Moranbacteria bacterium GW2011_GWE1_35_17]|nr:MAG: M23B-like protein peptidase [Candidatus Moranbacteria bacterium GW2011_GWE1_35_17]KKP82183.1 MAG: M23B-like protein peptidase [Candidatus Moranbacteria bacterium GW2011_GWF1_35_5]
MKNKIKFLLLIVFFLGASNISGVDFGVSKAWAVDCDVLTGEEKTACEDEKDDIEDDIEKLEKKINKTEAEKAQLDSLLKKKQGAVYTTSQAIANTQSQIDATEKNIKNKKQYLEELEKSIEKKKEALRKTMQENYVNSSQPFLFIFFDKDNFLDAVTSIDNLLRVKEEILILVDEIKKDRESVKNETVMLDNTVKEKEELLDIKESQKKALEREAYAIQEEVEEKAESIESLRSKLSETKNDLNKLLGKSYDTNDVKEAIKFASKQTGVRKGFLFGMLSIESRLGASVGGCDFKQSRMSAARATIFKDICEELDYNYKKQKVSCPPSSYKGTGGAMGAAQFMSDTWRGYESKIANASGHSVPDPWNLVDGVMAMALKLENDGATKGGKTTIASPCNGKKISIKWEEYASLKYLGWSCYGLTNYAKRVQALSGNYDQL